MSGRLCLVRNVHQKHESAHGRCVTDDTVQRT